MIIPYLPRFGQCIETPAGQGIVNGIVQIQNGDYLLLVANFAEGTIDRITVSEWNQYAEETGVLIDMEN